MNVRDYERLPPRSSRPGALGYFAGGANDEMTLRDNIDAFGRWPFAPGCSSTSPAARPRRRCSARRSRCRCSSRPIAYQRVAHPDGEVAWRGRRAPRARSCASRRTRRRAGGRHAIGSLAGTSCTRSTTTASHASSSRRRARRVRRADADGGLAGARPPRARRAHGVRHPDQIAHPRTVAGSHAAQRFNAVLALADLARGRALRRVGGAAGDPQGRPHRRGCAPRMRARRRGARRLESRRAAARRRPAAIDALPEVVEAVDGRIEVLFDGGIRRGTDVVKALALGARAVLVGRAPLWGLAVDGEAGARQCSSFCMTRSRSRSSSSGARAGRGDPRACHKAPLSWFRL